MLWVLAGIEVVLWIYGMSTHHRMGGVLHSLLALAAIAVLTELGLRYRRTWLATRPASHPERQADWRKAA